jgi:hypothetical protein
MKDEKKLVLAEKVRVQTGGNRVRRDLSRNLRCRPKLPKLMGVLESLAGQARPMMLRFPEGRLTAAARLQKVPAEVHRCTGRRIALSLLQSQRLLPEPARLRFRGGVAFARGVCPAARDVLFVSSTRAPWLSVLRYDVMSFGSPLSFPPSFPSFLPL